MFAFIAALESGECLEGGRPGSDMLVIEGSDSGFNTASFG
jgi:hypothetical protein